LKLEPDGAAMLRFTTAVDIPSPQDHHHDASLVPRPRSRRGRVVAAVGLWPPRRRRLLRMCQLWATTLDVVIAVAWQAL